MQRLEVSGAVRPIYGSLGFKRLILSHSRAVAKVTLHSTCNNEEGVREVYWRKACIHCICQMFKGSSLYILFIQVFLEHLHIPSHKSAHRHQNHHVYEISFPKHRVSSDLCATRYTLCTEPSLASLELQPTRRECCRKVSNYLIPGRDFGCRNQI